MNEYSDMPLIGVHDAFMTKLSNAQLLKATMERLGQEHFSLQLRASIKPTPREEGPSSPSFGERIAG